MDDDTQTGRLDVADWVLASRPSARFFDEKDVQCLALVQSSSGALWLTINGEQGWRVDTQALHAFAVRALHFLKTRKP